MSRWRSLTDSCKRCKLELHFDGALNARPDAAVDGGIPDYDVKNAAEKCALRRAVRHSRILGFSDSRILQF